MQDVCPVAHEFDVLGRAVCALPVHDGAFEHVGELGPRAEKRGADEVDHAPVLHQVVLQRVARQHHSPPEEQTQSIICKTRQICHLKQNLSTISYLIS